MKGQHDKKFGNKGGKGGTPKGKKRTPTVRTEEDKKPEKDHIRGRPPRNYDPKILENLCKANCTVDEIEAILNTNQVTIDKWCLRYYKVPFKEVYDAFKLHGKASLRRIQFKLAEKNAGMAIFLGKNLLGQTDQTVQTIKSEESVSETNILELPDNGRRHVENKSD